MNNFNDIGPFEMSYKKSNLICERINLTLQISLFNIVRETSIDSLSYAPKNFNGSDNCMIYIFIKNQFNTSNSHKLNKGNHRKSTDGMSQVAVNNVDVSHNQQTRSENYQSQSKINENEYEYLLSFPNSVLKNNNSKINSKNNINNKINHVNVDNTSTFSKVSPNSYKGKRSVFKDKSLNYSNQNEISKMQNEKPSINLTSKIRDNINTNYPNKLINIPPVHDNKTNKYIVRNSESSTDSKPNQLFLAKLSGLIHDFKHVVIDNTFFFKNLIKQYGIALKIEDLVYIKTMKKYVQFLVKNLTLFFNDQNNFLKGDTCENFKPVDIIFLLDNLIGVFNRRLIFENTLKHKDNLQGGFLKKVKIYHKIIDPLNSNYKKLISNKNLLMSIFYNLLSNSYKETEEGEICVETSINEYKKEILVRIIDTGKGMPENVKNNWGLPFHKFGENAGTGLGQFLIETVKKSLNLFIPRPEDNPNDRGTIISVYIPLDHKSDLNQIPSNSNISRITKINTFKACLNLDEKKYINNNLTYNNASDRKKSIYFHDDNLNDTYINNNIQNSIVPIIFNVLVLDDDYFAIKALQEKVEKDLKFSSMRFKFEFVYVRNFDSFFKEFTKMILSPKKVFDFLILDQNIEFNVKGLDVAEMICKIYDAYNLLDNKFFNFIFLTEESQLFYKYRNTNKLDLNYHKYSDIIFHKGGNIFGKSETKLVKN